MFSLETGLYLSQRLDNLSDPANPFLYYPSQLLLVSGLSYTGTTILNAVWIISTPPVHGMVFIVVAFAVRELILRVFYPSFQPYIKENLSPLAFKFLQWTVSLLASKIICALFEVNIKLNQIGWICLGFFIAYRIMRIAIETFRSSLEPLNTV